jgi:imidazolonepropionase-like amidohydrolase
MLARGFTTVRDMGGADFGIAQAVAEGYLCGPRILYCGKALSPTGGHGDLRPMGVDRDDDAYSLVSLGRRCDGVPEVRRAARDEIRRGASHIKIMVNGGTASPNDRITSDQFSEEEIVAIVDEAAMANLYVAAHTYTARCIARAVKNGVRSIEHANLIDEETIQLMKDRGAFMVPTLAAFNAYAKVGASAGVSGDSLKKNALVLDAGIRALEMAYRAGLQIAFGTDLIGPMHKYQLTEIELRAEVMPLIEIIRSATTTAAQLIREEDVGQVSPGFRADLLILCKDPRSKGVLCGLDRHISMVVKNGKLCLDHR